MSNYIRQNVSNGKSKTVALSSTFQQPTLSTPHIDRSKLNNTSKIPQTLTTSQTPNIGRLCTRGGSMLLQALFKFKPSENMWIVAGFTKLSGEWVFVDKYTLHK